MPGSIVPLAILYQTAKLTGRDEKSEAIREAHQIIDNRKRPPEKHVDDGSSKYCF